MRNNESLMGHKQHRGVNYYANRREAREIADWLYDERGYHESRVIEYGRGFAIQYRISGPYFPELER